MNLRTLIKEQIDLLQEELGMANNALTEATDFKKLKKNRVELTDEERAECMKREAVWHFSPKNKPSPAVWKSVNDDGDVTYVTNTHRAYNTAKTLKGAIGRFHKFIKGTA